MPNICGQLVNNECIQCGISCGVLSPINGYSTNQSHEDSYKSQVIPLSALKFTQYLCTRIISLLEVLLVQFYPLSTTPIINSTKGI